MTDDRLFDIAPDWAEHWQDMPEFTQRDERPSSSINVYFRTEEDRQEFLGLVGCTTPDRKRGIWYPFRPLPRDSFDRDFEPDKVLPNKYPVYVISKGRWGMTGGFVTHRALDKLGIDYRIVVEPQERKQYAEHIDDEKILVLPFQDLGQGSIPARNWVWNHAVQRGAERHWILDDNIADFARLNNNQIRIIKDANPFLPCEGFVDRYRNIGLAGMQYRGFADSAHPDLAPYRLNTRIYSCILINHALPFRWRGRYNEDTDLSLRALKAGWVTVLFNSHQIHKAQTMTMIGGNTDELYDGDGRLAMAESLRDQHPDLVTVTEKWGRSQHHVDYSPFKYNQLVLKDQLDLLEPSNGRNEDVEAHNGSTGSGLESGAGTIGPDESGAVDSERSPVALGDEDAGQWDGGGTDENGSAAEVDRHSSEPTSPNGDSVPVAGVRKEVGRDRRPATVGGDPEEEQDDDLLGAPVAGGTEDSQVDGRQGLDRPRYSQEKGEEIVRQLLEDRQLAMDAFAEEVIATCRLCGKPVRRNQPRKLVGTSTVRQGALVHGGCG